MFKVISNLFLSLIFLLLVVGRADAAISVRLDQPKSPTNQNNFKVTFTALDTDGDAVSVKCFKKGPSDGAFGQFGGDVAIAAGGNAGSCPSVSSFVSTEGTYQFYAEAQGGSDSATSSTISVDYKTTGPGTPTNYSKDKISSCVYRIKFKTADDGGKTVQVRLYRTDSTTSEAAQVDTVSIGSNTEGQFENTIPDCGKEYFYALRAFDSAGNSSGLVGDSISVTTSSTTTTTVAAPTGGAGGAIPLRAGQGQVLGEATEEKQEVLGEEATPSGAPIQAEEQKEQKKPLEKDGFLSPRNILTGAVVVAILALIYLWYRKSKQTV